MTVSSIGCPAGAVKLYDSLSSCTVCKHVVKQVTTILNTDQPQIIIDLP